MTKKLSGSLEDYLEAIFNLVAANDVARSKDIADLLGVSKPSVTGALKQLSRKKLVSYKPYGYVTLTEAGIFEAERIVRKHRAIESFFVDVLHVDSKVAEEAACRAEHALGPEVISRLVEFNRFVNNVSPGSKSSVADKFRRFQRRSR